MKNHELVNGRLLQTNKQYSALKESQKTRIAEWMYESYRDYYVKNKKLPYRAGDTEVLRALSDKIETVGIWIPDGEVTKHYYSRKNKLRKRLQKEFAADFLETEKIKTE